MRNLTPNILDFIKEFDKMGGGVCKVRLAEHKFIEENNTDFIRFEIHLKENKMLRTGILSPTDDYYFIVEKLIKKHFKTEPGFNNTGATFWVWIKPDGE